MLLPAIPTALAGDGEEAAASVDDEGLGLGWGADVYLHEVVAEGGVPEEGQGVEWEELSGSHQGWQGYEQEEEEGQGHGHGIGCFY